MIESIDAYLVGLEFSQEELYAISHRGFLYSGICLMALLTLSFAGLTLISLF